MLLKRFKRSKVLERDKVWIISEIPPLIDNIYFENLNKKQQYEELLRYPLNFQQGSNNVWVLQMRCSIGEKRLGKYHVKHLARYTKVGLHILDRDMLTKINEKCMVKEEEIWLTKEDILEVLSLKQGFWEKLILKEFNSHPNIEHYIRLFLSIKYIKQYGLCYWEE